MSKLSNHRHLPRLSLALASGTLLYSCAPSKVVVTAPPKRPVAGNPVAGNVPAGNVKPPLASVHFERQPTVEGIYVTAWTAGDGPRLAKLAGLLDRTELNAMAIDVRDSGEMYFDTGIPLAAACGANKHAVRNPATLMATLEKHHIWPIARIACFRDNFVPRMHPELAVQLPNGSVWHDRSHHSWLDPYNRKNWEYLAQVVDYAINIGFPEVQLDYVRFPSEGKASSQRYPGKKTWPNPKDKPEDVIARFATYIANRVHARNGIISADIFGIISSVKGDEGIGQELEKVAGPFDVISPMVYPSHFARGEYGIPNPNTAPYQIIHKSLADFKKRLPKMSVRPWLQDFSLFGVHYGAKQVQAQLKAARELGYKNFLLWNAGNRYTEAALAKDPSMATTSVKKDGRKT